MTTSNWDLIDAQPEPTRSMFCSFCLYAHWIRNGKTKTTLGIRFSGQVYLSATSFIQCQKLNEKRHATVPLHLPFVVLETGCVILFLRSLDLLLLGPVVVIIQRNLVYLPRDQLLRTTLHRRMFSDILCWSNLSFWDLNQSSKISVSAFSIIKWCSLQVLWMQVAAKFFFSDKCSTKKVKTNGTKQKRHP